MTKKSTKKSLAMSIISLVLCLAMLIGSTYAWFSDTATTGDVKITAGNLDVEIVKATLADGKYTASDAYTDQDSVFTENPDKWEPGMMVTSDPFMVKNNGTLALKYQLDVAAKKVGKTEKNLLDVVKYKIVKATDFTLDGQEVTYQERKEAWNAITEEKEASIGTLETKDDTSEALKVVLFWEPIDSTDPLPENNKDNEYNIKGATEANELKAEFTLNVFATQASVESDSFGNKYDADVPLHSWDGETEDTEWFNPDEPKDEYTISTPEALAGFADLLDKGESEELANTTITLEQDAVLDFGGNEIPSIGTPEKPFKGTFNGNGATLQNLKVKAEDDTKAGLFPQLEKGAVVEDLTVRQCTIEATDDSKHVGVLAGDVQAATIRDVTLEDCTVKGGTDIGAIAGYTFTGDKGSVSIENCTVKDCTIDGTDRVGGILGSGYMNTLKNLTVENCELICNEDGSKTGGIIGQIHEMHGNPTFENLKVKNTTVKTNSQWFDLIGGIAAYSLQDSDYTFKNCTVTNFTVISGDRSAPERIGGIIGQIDNHISNPVKTILDGCKVTDLSIISSSDNIGSVGGLVGRFGIRVVQLQINNCESSFKELKIENPRQDAGQINSVGMFVGYGGCDSSSSNTITCTGANKYTPYTTNYTIDSTGQGGKIGLWGSLTGKSGTATTVTGEDTITENNN